MNKWAFAWKQQRTILVWASAAFVVALLVVQPWTTQPRTAWWQALDAILGAATLAVAVIVWFGELNESWEHSLPKRLKVVYLFEGRPVMVCEDSVLTAESDIRSMAQQMGAQMNGERNLKLGGIIDSVTPRIEQVPGVGRVRRYEIRVTLTSLPEKVEAIRRKDSTAVLVRRIVGGEVVDEPMTDYHL